MSESLHHLFGIRHHGAGCARSLVRALQALEPDCILIEGPPEGETLLSWVNDPALEPPIALLVYANDKPQKAAFFPFAAFSPEWQAIRYGLNQQLPVRFMDLAQTHALALDLAAEAAEAAAEHSDQTSEEEGAEGSSETSDAIAELASNHEHVSETENTSEAVSGSISEENTEDETHDDDESESITASGDSELLYLSPLDWLGKAAGYADGEAWWNAQIEEAGNDQAVFSAITDVMTTLRADAEREDHPDYQRRLQSTSYQRDILREATMRQAIRQAYKDGFKKIAVVCGAWHVPALQTLPAAKADTAVLKGLPKTKVTATWVPWSYPQLSRDSGYGAGVDSPAWYDHLWHSNTAEERTVGWLSRAARLFREKDIDCSSAHVIDAVRVSQTLATLRYREEPGLDELQEALKMGVCMGDETPLQMIYKKLIVGDKLGSTPENIPQAPLALDLQKQQKSLRLKPEASQKMLDLDLRKENDLARSHLLHRLAMLDIPWGKTEKTGYSKKGTFHEVWNLQWEPQFFLDIILASRWGASVEAAATAFIQDAAEKAERLEDLADIVDKVLLADLSAALTPIMQALEVKAIETGDISQLLRALPRLAGVSRYGNVRQTDTQMLKHVLHQLVPRVCISLPNICCGLNDEAAAELRKVILATHQAVKLLDDPDLTPLWNMALLQLVHQELTAHALLRGMAVRLLSDDQLLEGDEVALLMSRSLSSGLAPIPVASWIEGFLNDNALVLLHNDRLWGYLNEWIYELSSDHFQHILPLLRRTFGLFNPTERRQLGERARRVETDSGVVMVSGNESLSENPRLLLPLPFLSKILPDLGKVSAS